MLSEHRSLFPHRAAFVANSRQDLLHRMDEWVQSFEEHKLGVAPTMTPRPNASRRVLGIFTGQGAQWPSMGCALISHCTSFANSIRRLDACLQTLPQPPDWSIALELVKNHQESRVYQPEFSQPLCTAVQIGIVNLLYESGFHFDAVVGHSSGEIAAVSRKLIVKHAN